MEDWRIVVRQKGPGAVENPDDAATTTTTTTTNNPGGNPGGVKPTSTSQTEGVPSQQTATTTSGSAKPTQSTHIVKFSTDVFNATNAYVFTSYPRIFRADAIRNKAISFDYFLDGTFEPLMVSLFQVEDKTDSDKTNITLATGSGPLAFTSGAIKLDYEKLAGGAEEGTSAKSSIDGKVLALNMYWKSTNGSITGHTYSPYFAILAESVLQTSAQTAQQLQSSITNAGTEAADGWDADVSTAAATSTATNTANDGTNVNSGSGGGGGLATGAIVGIAIGAAAGVAIIAALAWFLLRRRKNKDESSPLTDGGASNAYIADKDSTAQSPQSPYADDVIHNPRADSSSLHNTTHDNIPGPRDGSGTATPSGLSRNVAHLVEEGMTADDIARLEEEERQLDDEIERAAGVASAAGRR